MSKRGRGRPSEIASDVSDKILKLIMAGNYLETAAAFNDVPPSTVRSWVKRGKKERRRLGLNPRATLKESEKPYVDFSLAVEKALGVADVRDLSVIDKAAQGGAEVVTTTVVEREVPVVLPDGTTGTRTERVRTTVTSRATPIWTAAAWRLERRSPDRFGRRQTVEARVGDTKGKPLPTGNVVIYLPDNGRGDGPEPVAPPPEE